jgi:hypothetical protein
MKSAGGAGVGQSVFRGASGDGEAVQVERHAVGREDDGVRQRGRSEVAAEPVAAGRVDRVLEQALADIPATLADAVDGVARRRARGPHAVTVDAR